MLHNVTRGNLAFLSEYTFFQQNIAIYQLDDIIEPFVKSFYK